MSCKRQDIAEKLILFVEKDLSEKEYFEIAEHVSICPNCRADIEKLTEIMKTLGEKSKQIKTSMVHPSAEELVQWTFSKEEIPAERRSLISSHISLCPVCSKEIQLIQESPVIEMETSITEDENESIPISEKIMDAYIQAYGRKEKDGATKDVSFEIAPNSFVKTKAPSLWEKLVAFFIPGRRLAFAGIGLILFISLGLIVALNPYFLTGRWGTKEEVVIYAPRIPTETTPILKGDGKLPVKRPDPQVTELAGTPNAPGLPVPAPSMWIEDNLSRPDLETGLRFQTAFLELENEPNVIEPLWGPTAVPSTNPDVVPPHNIREDLGWQVPITLGEIKEREETINKINNDLTEKVAKILKSNKKTADYKVNVFVTLSPFKDKTGEYQIRGITVFIRHTGSLSPIEKSSIARDIDEKMKWNGMEMYMFDPME